MKNVVNFPVWRANSSPIEKLREVLQYAESHPEEMSHLIVLCENSCGQRQQYFDGSMTNVQAVGMLELAKLDIALEREGD